MSCTLKKIRGYKMKEKLTKGGIIQDKNGKLCKDGDRIREGRKWE